MASVPTSVSSALACVSVDPKARTKATRALNGWSKQDAENGFSHPSTSRVNVNAKYIQKPADTYVNMKPPWPLIVSGAAGPSTRLFVGIFVPQEQ